MSGLIWAHDNSGVYFGVESEGSKNEYFVSTGGAVHPVTTGTHVLTVTDIAANGTAVGVNSTPVKPNDVVSIALPKAAGTTSAFNQLTTVDDDVLAGKALATTEEVWYKSKDGLEDSGLDREAGRASTPPTSIR